MAKHLERVPGPKLSGTEWLQARTLRADGEKSVTDKEWPKAIEAYTALVKFAIERVRKWGEDGLEEVNKEGLELLRVANLTIEAGEKGSLEAGKKMLRKIAKDFKPLSAAKLAEDRLKVLNSRPK